MRPRAGLDVSEDRKTSEIGRNSNSDRPARGPVTLSPLLAAQTKYPVTMATVPRLPLHVPHREQRNDSYQGKPTKKETNEVVVVY